MIIEKVTITNKLGLHARAASKFVATAQQFSSEVTVTNGEHEANGKSIMAVMMLQGSPGTELTLHINGDDEEQALAAIIELISDKFGEEE
ncbi:MAG: HPr family phosphocarrier protein [Pseudomonadales bacterium]|nr:HPr family phosphocarrier protein [Pseudomonadales bacterium]